jgi:hypothetical protein
MPTLNFINLEIKANHEKLKICVIELLKISYSKKSFIFEYLQSNSDK